MLNVYDALDLIAETVSPTAPQIVSLADAAGSLLAVDIASPEDSPPFDKSMMDGYAARLADMKSGEATFDVIGEITAGYQPEDSVASGSAIRIMTGAPIPVGADVVIPVEQSEMIGDARVKLSVDRKVGLGWNIIGSGTNMRRGENVLTAGTRIRPQEIALLAEMGQARVSVRKSPRVAILATGDELVPVEETPGPGQIRNSNARMLAAQVQAIGAEPVVLGIARDVCLNLQAKIEEGLQCDFLCLSGGVSAGVLDLVPSMLKKAGVEQVFHKVAMKPGKPIWFGSRESESSSACYVFGLPGNPVSSMVCFELFVAAALRRFAGKHSSAPELLDATLLVNFKQRGNREVWFPSRVSIENGVVVVEPTGWKGSSDLRSTVAANCSARFPAGEQHFQAGEIVKVLLWSGSEITSKLWAD